MKDTDLAWAAGITDGEGSIRKHINTKTGYHLLCFSVSQAEDEGTPEMLLRLQKIFKVGAIYGPMGNKSNRRSMYEYRASGKAALKIVNLIWPYLGNVKRRQAINTGLVVEIKAEQSGPDRAVYLQGSTLS